MVGNMVVWIDACNADACRTAGESSAFRAKSSAALGPNNNVPGRCDGTDHSSADFHGADVGFRCCASPLQP